MKKQCILVSILSILCLAACGQSNGPASSNGGDSQGSSQKPAGDNHFVIENFGTSKFEAEKFEVKDWDAIDGEAVVSDDKASGGAYLAAAEQGSEAVFYFSLQA